MTTEIIIPSPKRTVNVYPKKQPNRYNTPRQEPKFSNNLFLGTFQLPSRIKNMIRRKPYLLLLLTLIGALFIPQSTSAQDDDEPPAGLTLTVEAGFDGFYKSDHWLPVHMTVANNGPAIEGELRITIGANNEAVVYSSPVSLPTQSNKRITQLVKTAGSIRVVSVELVDENGRLITRALSQTLRIQNFNELIYGVVSTDPDEFEFLENVTAGRSDAVVAFLDMEDLPATAVAWNALDILIFNDIDSNEMSNAQRAALETWVSTGGQLVVTGGPGWQKTATPFSDMLPVTLTGSESTNDLPTLVAETGIPFRDAGPYLLAASSLRRGDLIFHQDGLPLLARQNWGRGSVFFLALDPKLAPLLDWDGSEVVFEQIASHVPETPPWATGIQNGYAAGSAVTSLPSLALPSATTLIIFLLIYVIIIGPANYIFLKRTNRRELAWVTTPIIVIIFAVTAYVIGFQLKGNNIIINQMNVAHGQIDSDQMRVQSLVGLYSPRRANYDVIMPLETAVHPFERDSGNITGNGTLDSVTRDTNLVLKNILVDVSGVETFIATSSHPTPELTGEAQMSVNNNVVTLDINLQNNTNFDLEKVVIIAGRQAFSLGDMDAGETYSNQHTLNRAIVTGSGSFMGNTGSTLLDNADMILGTSTPWDDPIAFPRMQLLEALDGRSYGNDARGTVPNDIVTLVAWANTPLLDLTIENTEYDTLQTTLYFIEIPLQRNVSTGDEVTLPLALLDWSVLSSSNNVYEASATNFYLPSGGWVELEYTPWEEFRNMDATSLTIRLLADGNSSSPPAIRIWDWENENWHDVENVNLGSTRIVDFQPYLNTNNKVRLHIRSDGTNISVTELYPVLVGNVE